MPLPLTVSCSSKIQIGFTFLVLADPGRPGHVLADPGRPGQRAIKRVCMCVYVCLTAVSDDDDDDVEVVMMMLICI